MDLQHRVDPRQHVQLANLRGRPDDVPVPPGSRHWQLWGNAQTRPSQSARGGRSKGRAQNVTTQPDALSELVRMNEHLPRLLVGFLEFRCEQFEIELLPRIVPPLS